MKLAIIQRKSAIGRDKGQKATILALGIKNLNKQVIHQDSPQVRGMVDKVAHLLEVREIED